MAGNKLDGSHIINIDDPIIATKEEPYHYSWQGGIDGKCSIDIPLIRKIGNNIRDEDKKTYEPNILSIGPYHHGKLATKSVETMKYECLAHILRLNKEKNLNDYMQAIRNMEKQIRNYYSDEIEMDRNNFLKMLLLDGCFMILILNGVEGISQPMSDMTKSNKKLNMKTDQNTGEIIIDMEALEVHEIQQNIREEDDSYHIRMWYSDFFKTDILLLENQIPFSVITKIYEIAAGENNDISLLMESITAFIEGTIECYSTSITPFNRPKHFHHLLHLCHMYFKPSKRNFEEHESLDRKTGHWRRATEYYKSGIQFKKREISGDDPHSLLDIDFRDGMLEIPCLNIYHNTRCLFRNLLAFEQTSPQFENYVTAYVVFWSQFVTTPDDVALLTKRGIIVHQLNSDAEVSNLFTKLREGVDLDLNDDCYLNSTYNVMEAYYNRNKPRLKAWLG